MSLSKEKKSRLIIIYLLLSLIIIGCLYVSAINTRPNKVIKNHCAKQELVQ